MTGLVTDTGDHQLIRQSTAAIAARYGHAETAPGLWRQFKGALAEQAPKEN